MRAGVVNAARAEVAPEVGASSDEPQPRRAGASAPGSSAPDSDATAGAWALRLARTHYENFPVLGPLVPRQLRPDFAAIYAFCRTADDLADETGTGDAARSRSLALLSAWRERLHACAAGERPVIASTDGHPTDPLARDAGAVFAPLARTIARHRLPLQPFQALLDAFERDQRQSTWDSWDDLLSYCTRSANPVGHLVLMIGGVRPPDEGGPDAARRAEIYRLSDLVCTALQLTNFWQDVRRDLLERGRVYLPVRDCALDERTLRDWAVRPHDPAARVPFIRALRPLVERTRAMFDEARALPFMLPREIGPVVWMFAGGGRTVLEKVERAGCATLWTRPRLSKPDRALLLLRAALLRSTRRWEVGA